MCKIYYMVESSTKNGFLLYSEEQEVSSYWGTFVCFKEDMDRNISIKIDAVYKKEIKTYTLEKESKDIYYLEVPEIGKFYFQKKVMNWRKNKYIGKVLKKTHNILNEFIPMNSDFFEYACKMHEFFFIGNKG